MGGLGTPRTPCAIRGGGGAEVLDGRATVRSEVGADHTEAYLVGARRTLELLRVRGVVTFYGKARSPSCGRDTHSVFGRPAEGDGVTTAFLKRPGFRVIEVHATAPPC